MHGAEEGEATDEVAEGTSRGTEAIPCLAALGAGRDEASLLSDELLRRRLADEDWLTRLEASSSGRVTPASLVAAAELR